MSVVQHKLQNEALKQSHQWQHDDDDNHQAQHTTGPIAPAAAMWAEVVDWNDRTTRLLKFP